MQILLGAVPREERGARGAGGRKMKSLETTGERNRPFHHSSLIRFEILRRLRIVFPAPAVSRVLACRGGRKKNPNSFLLITSGTRAGSSNWAHAWNPY